MSNPEGAIRTESTGTPSTESGTRTAGLKGRHVGVEASRQPRGAGTGSGRHVGVYLPEPILSEMEREAKRQDRSLSYLARVAWTIARDHIRTLPDAPTISE
jgi:uncharacterized small protein (TIGR04563 family)